MAKRDISKTLLKGSAKDRMLLLTSDYASKVYGEKGFLTDEEVTQLADSFNTSQEINVYKAFKRQSELTENSIYILQIMANEFYETAAYLTGLSLLWRAYGYFDDTLNEIIYSISEKSREEIIKYIANIPERYKDYVFAKMSIEKDEEGEYIHISRDTGEKGLRELLILFKNKAIQQLVTFKTFIKATRDSNEEKDFNVKIYNDKIEKIEKEVKERISEVKNTFPLAALKDIDIEEVILKGNYTFFLDYDKIKIDEAEYKFYRKHTI